jgi:radical SAM protein with 4Fe4S-binding SPASM domain
VPPFKIAYWPVAKAIFGEAAVPDAEPAAMNDDAELSARFLLGLSERVPNASVFKPALLPFKCRPEDIDSHEQFRRHMLQLTYRGECSRSIILGALEMVAQRLEPNARINVLFKGWDPLTCWPESEQTLSDVLSHLGYVRGHICSAIAYSKLEAIPPRVLEYLYDRPRLRLGWVGDCLSRCESMPQLRKMCRDSHSIKNLEKLAELGAWPHVLLPASRKNIRILPDIVSTLVELTRGGTIHVVPVTANPEWSGEAPPAVDDYVRALMAVYREPHIPSNRVAPQSWVAARIDSETPLVSCPEAAGASVAVEPTGDLYAGDLEPKRDRWRLGNVLEQGAELRWELLDVMAEAFTNSIKPNRCHDCDWRYRCGGAGGIVARLQSNGGEALNGFANASFEFYCASRKALFEEMLWDSVLEGTRDRLPRPRESLEISKTGVKFVAAPTTRDEVNV